MEKFTNLYPVSKTLRFELIPQGETLRFLEERGLITQDEQRAEKYKKVKKIIDRYHKAYISKALSGFNLKGLQEYLDNFAKKDEDQKKKITAIEENLRKQIANRLGSQDEYKTIFSKELIKDDLVKFLDDPDEGLLVAEFDRFTTYFTGFHQNRQNMYTAEEKSTAIAYRLINQNLPKFVDNMGIFEKVKQSDVANKFDELYANFKEYLKVNSIVELFEIEYYSIVLTQEQIDVYNAIIGGKTTNTGAKIQGLNEFINLHNQKQTDRSRKLPKLKPLYKQILSDREAISWLPDEFEKGKDNEVLESIELYYRDFCNHVLQSANDGEMNIEQLLKRLKEYDLDRIFIRNDLSLTDISQKFYGHWGTIQKAVENFYHTNQPKKPNESIEKFEERTKKYFKSYDSFSISFINQCLATQGEDQPNIEEYFLNLGAKAVEGNNNYNLIQDIHHCYGTASDLLNQTYPVESNLSQEKNDVAKIKALLDSIKQLQWFVKPLLGKGNEAIKDERFYGELTRVWDHLDNVTLLYNKVRNYMTLKPYSLEKFKLNFENSTLLDGWDVNKETDNTCVLLRKNGNYYLGIINVNHRNVFKEKLECSNGSCYEKMEYKLLPGANKMLPKVFFSKSRIDEFGPSQVLVENYKNETHKKGPNFRLKDCHALINFFKQSIDKHSDWKNFEFNFSDTSSYEDLSGFYREVEQQGYKLSFVNFPEAYIDELVSEGKLYLFQIYNKDFSPNSKGKPNLHTLYWKMLFDRDNLRDVVYKLNGQAEIFYRRSSINKQNAVMHKANSTLVNKNEENNKKTSSFTYDIIKDRRFTVDKFQFHVPITMNHKATGNSFINPLVNAYIKEQDKMHVIGVDRGERHLLYIVVVNEKGKLVEQFSLNQIVNIFNENSYTTNYREMLEKREDARQRERESWRVIESIKELKQGYLSQVVHKICKLMLKYNAVVVLEDLNMGFKQDRQKFEKSVYQQFEKMLIDKLNYLVDKDLVSTPAKPGGAFKAFQLTNKFQSFQKLGKQSGFLFYIPAWNTSKMDPATGFVNLFYTRYESVEKTRGFFNMFKSVTFNKHRDYFQFEVDNYTAFNTRAEDTRQNWNICTYGPRIETFRDPLQNNQWASRTVFPTQELKSLFSQFEIEYQAGNDLKGLISSRTEKPFFERLLYIFGLTLQMRNSEPNSENDYLVSPVKGFDGVFFDSNLHPHEMPANADANGAYNIARKGMWVIEQIKKTNDLTKIKIAMTNKEWLQYAQRLVGG